MRTTFGCSASLARAASRPSAVITVKSSPPNVISRTLRIGALSSTASRVFGTDGSSGSRSLLVVSAQGHGLTYDTRKSRAIVKRTVATCQYLVNPTDDQD